MSSTSCVAAPRVMLAMLLLPWAVTTAIADSAKEADETGQQLARQLAEAGVQFDLDGQDDYARLSWRAALQEDTDCELARWRLGYIRYGDQWVAADGIQLLTSEAAVREEYRQRRSSTLDTGPRELDLAAWCRSQGWEDVARVHLRRVAQSAENDSGTRSAALRRLGLRMFAGQLMTDQQIVQLRDAWRTARRELYEWSPRLDKWSSQLTSRNSSARRAAEKALREIDDPLAIPALELVFSSQNEQLAREAVHVIAAMKHPAASESLVRHAVAAPWPTVRELATTQLRRRSMPEYVPVLLSALQSPIQTVFRIAAGPSGQAFHQHVLLREGIEEDVALEISSQVSESVALGPARQRTAPELLAAAQGIATRIEQAVAAENNATGQQNERVYAVLAQTTGATVNDSPRAWWDWWREYNDYQAPETRPLRQYQQQVAYYQLPTVMPVHECFPPGTTVWTDRGQVAIEEIKVGDRVLSQDVNTGRLQYKPVAQITRRLQAEMQTVQLGDHALTLTTGHPLWVNGKGWRMARRLHLGDRVHSIDGSLPVMGMQVAAPSDAYNLVVADFAAYFVTDQGILVHDNTYRTPTQAVTPGLMASN